MLPLALEDYPPSTLTMSTQQSPPHSVPPSPPHTPSTSVPDDLRASQMPMSPSISIYYIFDHSNHFAYSNSFNTITNHTSRSFNNSNTTTTRHSSYSPSETYGFGGGAGTVIRASTVRPLSSHSQPTRGVSWRIGVLFRNDFDQQQLRIWNTWSSRRKSVSRTLRSPFHICLLNL